jgi:hypothetical protein
MPIDKTSVLRQIDEVLTRFREVDRRAAWDEMRGVFVGVPNDQAQEVITLITHAVGRFRPPGAVAYADEALTKNYGDGDQVLQMRVLSGILSALRADYQADRLQSLRELIHADLFADLLEQADHLMEQGYKDAAAVTAGAVLEEHLRKLCDRYSVPTFTTDAAGQSRPKMLNAMNADLARHQLPHGRCGVKEARGRAVSTF